MTTALADFDVCGPLPVGLTLLEASAGTGKTFTIAALVARYVAAGVPIDRLLVVTFTKAATSELRERVRERLVETEAGLRRAAAGSDPGGDSVLRLLAAGSPAEVGVRRRRVAAALAEFDAATIATTHGFCEHILAGLGTAGDVERNITFVADPRDLVAEVVDDLYLRKFYRNGPPPFTLAVARDIGQRAVDNPEAPIAPALDLCDNHPEPAMRARLAKAVRDEVVVRKLRHATMGYDDLLTRLVATLRSGLGPFACARLRERYAVVLVDEFQDTDPIQWDILRLAFGEATTMVLIGDPKQAIYSFRGADVWSYLDAAEEATFSATLGVNWRADQRLIDALDAVFDGATLGHPQIAYRKVRAAPGPRRSLEKAPDPAPLRVRVVHRADGAVRCNRDGTIQKDSARAVIAADLAHDIVGLLASGAELVGRDEEGCETTRDPVGPRHLAVLVRTNDEAEQVRSALERSGVAAVVSGAESVFTTDIAAQWLQLLRALERPAAQTRARAAALTCFLGWSPAAVAAATDADLARLQATLHDWSTVLGRDGVASLLETITVDQGLPSRLLRLEGGERQLTDLRHVGQLLHAEAVSGGLGLSALTGWLQLRIADAGRDAGADERSRRLESDADAVQVLTVYRSKGLEYPVVYLPYLWGPSYLESKPVPVYHDPDNHNRRTLDVGGQAGPGYGSHTRRYREEKEGEDLRLVYVALTRARHQVVVWWATTVDTPRSAWGRLLLRQADGSIPDTLSRPPTDQAVVGRLEALNAATAGCIAVERSGPPTASTLPARPGRGANLAVRRFERPLDTAWRRSSYSAITDPVHDSRNRDPRVASEPGATTLADESMPDLPSSPSSPTTDPGLRDVVSPMADLPGGTAIGTLVHSVLEAVDFAAPDLDAQLLGAVHQASAGGGGLCGLGPAMLATALRAAIDTPLGPVADDRRLRDIPAGDRLDELDFELPLVGGDQPTAELAVDAIAERLRAWLPPGDPLHAYPDRLDDPALPGDLHGYLAGSIDLVLRVRGQASARFVVVDYKTNRLGGSDEPLTAWHYRPEALAEAMQAAHYPLQALIYSVALHRYLRWKQPGYSPQRHLGGVAYLFLRGMSGADTPRIGATPMHAAAPVGVFAWTPPAGLITDLSDLFDRGSGRR